MTCSYNPRLDVLSFDYKRSQAPARDAALVTPHDTNDLPLYGKLRVYNPGPAVATVRVVVASNTTDDTTHVDLTVPAGVTYEQLIVRAVRVTGTTAGLTIHVTA